MASLETTVFAIAFGVFVIVGGAIAHNLYVSAQERKTKRRRRK